MKVVLLAGGLGSRISEESVLRPKPMIEVGGKPILWHIMKGYAAHGFKDFIICLGYKGPVIREYFHNYYMNSCDVTIDLSDNTVQIHNSSVEDWRVTLVDTGEHTQTGGRIRRIRHHLGDEPFMMTYGDAVADVDLFDLLSFHQKMDRLVTLSGVRPPGRFGNLHIENDMVESFVEKPDGDNAWINGGFFVVHPKAIDYLSGDSCIWEREGLTRIAADGQLACRRHEGYWQCMDTMRDKVTLEEMWASEKAPWKKW